MKDGSPQLLRHFTTGAGGLKSINLQPVCHLNRTFASVAAELSIVGVDPDGEGPPHRTRVPTDQFLLPASADEEISIWAEVHVDSLRFVLAQNSRFTCLWVDQPHIACEVRNREPTPLRLPGETDHRVETGYRGLQLARVRIENRHTMAACVIV